MSELATQLSEECGLSAEAVSHVLDRLAATAYREASGGFYLPGFGTFTVAVGEPQEGINPFTGEPAIFKGRPEVQFELNSEAEQSFLAAARDKPKLKVVDDDQDDQAVDRLPDIGLTPNEEDIPQSEFYPNPTVETDCKFGGAPSWIQSDETPNCLGCGRPMQLYAQLDSRVSEEFHIGDAGMLYVFWCQRCWRSQNVMQCY